MDRTGKYDAVDIISNIRGMLSIKYSNPLSFQSLGKGAFGTVGAGDTKTGIRKDLCDDAVSLNLQPGNILSAPVQNTVPELCVL